MGKRKDILSVIETINSIGITVDNRDWNACLNLFIDEPYVDYSSFSGQPAGKVKASELVEDWKHFLPGFDFTMHFITNHKVTVDGEKANCFSYIHALHRIKDAEGGETWNVYGTYEHELVKIEKNWKISKMKLNFKYQAGNLNLPKMAGDSIR